MFLAQVKIYFSNKWLFACGFSHRMGGGTVLIGSPEQLKGKLCIYMGFFFSEKKIRSVPTVSLPFPLYLEAGWGW